MAPSRYRRPGYSRRAQYGLFFGYVVAVAGGVIGAALLLLSRANPVAFGELRGAVAEVTAPVSALLARVGGAAASVPLAIGTWIDVHGENAQLRDVLARARPALVEGRRAKLENVRLRALLRARDIQPSTVATARLVGSSASSTRRFALLYAGHWQGVTAGQPVRAAEGLLGRVLEASPNTARVMLVTDPESVVPVRRLRDGLPALVAGRGDGLVDIRVIDTDDAHFRAGDIFVTSGAGGIFPPGILVARALRPGAEATPARPFARPDVTDFVSVLGIYAPPPPAAAAPTASPSPSPVPSFPPAAAAR